MIKRGEIIGLNNGKEYICLDSFEKNQKQYLYLLSNFKPVEVRFAIMTEGSDEIEVVYDETQIKDLLETFKARVDLEA